MIINLFTPKPIPTKHDAIAAKQENKQEALNNSQLQQNTAARRKLVSFRNSSDRFAQTCPREAKADKRRQRVEHLRKRVETMWQAAEKIREAARGWGDGDPDSVQEIMNKYLSYRFYQEFDDMAENVKVRHQKASAMLRELSKQHDTWPQFKEQLCTEQSKSYQQCYGRFYGTYQNIYYRCEFGIRKKVQYGECYERWD